ncbi:MAG: hypothetical protein ACRDT0_19395 [Pseudonocardiaceae bacterium]
MREGISSDRPAEYADADQCNDPPSQPITMIDVTPHQDDRDGEQGQQIQQTGHSMKVGVRGPFGFSNVIEDSLDLYYGVTNRHQQHDA